MSHKKLKTESMFYMALPVSFLQWWSPIDTAGPNLSATCLKSHICMTMWFGW